MAVSMRKDDHFKSDWRSYLHAWRKDTAEPGCRCATMSKFACHYLSVFNALPINKFKSITLFFSMKLFLIQRSTYTSGRFLCPTGSNATVAIKRGAVILYKVLFRESNRSRSSGLLTIITTALRFKFSSKSCNVLIMSKPDMDSMLPEAIEVTIFNQTYRLRSRSDQEHVREVARLVDERMRQISSQVTTHDVLKIAVLTALNIADEMQNLRNYYEQEVQPLLSRSSENQEEAEREGTSG